MKKIIFICLFFCGLSSFGQIKNQGFEEKVEGNSGLPLYWSLSPVKGYTASVVNDVKHDGNYSLKMEGKATEPSTFMSFSQFLQVDYINIGIARISVYIKSEKLNGSVAIWCQTWDENKKVIGFQNSLLQDVKISNTSDWQKYTLTIIINKDAKMLYFGAYTLGNGAVWFDDFKVEGNKKTDQHPASEVLDFNREFTEIVKKNSIYSNLMDWQSIQKDVVSLGKGMKTIADARILNRYVLQQLQKVGDNHSFIENKEASQNYATGNTVLLKPEAKLMANGIAYISVPAFGSTNKELCEEFAGSIQSLIRQLDTDNEIRGWIVDLRMNTGGNMYPMISGLGPLLDVGNLGYFVKGSKSNPWKNTKNGMNVNVRNPYSVKNKANKIAVLISAKTSSSGEMTAITFVGQQNSRLFGQPSGGYITANQPFKLSDGSNLLLATTHVADRNKKKYIDRIYPDVIIKPSSDQDTVLQAAQTWLISN